ncbi:MAG: TIGR00730 family Rossman fold protein [Pseudomonadota bacterium]
MSQNQSICVYCGSQAGSDPVFMETARQLGLSIAKHGLRLVYGGGTGGLMGASAQSAIDAGGRVTGIIPEFLRDLEAPRADKLAFDELIVTKDMHERKHAMFEKSGAFVALPGGIGTLEEIIEIMTWSQLGRHRRPMVLANISGFWDPLLELLNHMATSGFLHSAHLARPLVVTEADKIVPTIIAKWETGQADSGDRSVINKL